MKPRTPPRRTALRRLALSATGPLLAGLCGCGGQPYGESLPEREVSFEEWMPSAYRAIPRGTHALRNTADWSALWLGSPAQFAGDPYPTADKSTPTVDFTRHMLLVLSLGLGVRCNLPQVIRITDQDSVRRVYWKTHEDTGITTSACNYNYPLITLILAPAADATVEFIRSSPA